VLTGVRRTLYASICCLVFVGKAWSYRPYDSTDADVADEGEVELELGSREARFDGAAERAIRAVVNYGIGRDRELIVEGEWVRQESTPGDFQTSFADAGVFLKQVHRRGTLQGQKGLSVASECGLLIPTRADESGIGGECALIASRSISFVSIHANVAIAYDTLHRWTPALGIIAEGSDTWKLRPGIELVYERPEGESSELALLAGFIWSPVETLSLDVAHRWGIEPTAQLREWRIGMTWSH
jgi:hypothetical protein